MLRPVLLAITGEQTGSATDHLPSPLCLCNRRPFGRRTICQILQIKGNRALGLRPPAGPCSVGTASPSGCLWESLWTTFLLFSDFFVCARVPIQACCVSEVLRHIWLRTSTRTQKSSGALRSTDRRACKRFPSSRGRAVRIRGSVPHPGLSTVKKALWCGAVWLARRSSCSPSAMRRA